MLFAVAIAWSLPAVVCAQTPQPSPTVSTWSNLPGAIILLIPLAVGGALYVSYKLGSPDPTDRPVRREGAVSRTLAEKGTTDA